MSILATYDFSHRYRKSELDAILDSFVAKDEDFAYICTALQKKDLGRPDLLNFSFLFSEITDKNVSIGLKVIKMMIDWAASEERPTVLRVLFRYFEKIVIPKSEEGRLLDLSWSLLASMRTPVAIKVFAMTTAYNIARSYPEILTELKATIEMQLPHGSAGFKSRGNKICRKIDGLLSK